MARLSPALFAAAVALGVPAFAAPTAAHPRLVLMLVVDGLPYDQLERYHAQYVQGGFRRLLEQGADFTDAHQAHGVTVTAVGHTAIATGAYPYKHGIISNNWVDDSGKVRYCTEDERYTYIGEKTEPMDGTSPARVLVETLGDQLRYTSGMRSKVIAVSGKDRGAILMGGKSGTAYMYMDRSGDFATSTYYMARYPAWVTAFNAARPQDRYQGKTWTPLLPPAAYAGDAPDPSPPKDRFPFTWGSDSGKAQQDYYMGLKAGPAVDELTLDFARAALAGEQLGHNPTGATDLLSVSLSGHDYVNHAYGPESRMSHDHLLRLDRMLAAFFDTLDKQVGLDNTLVVLSADHGFSNTPEYLRAQLHIDAGRIAPDPLLKELDEALARRFGFKHLLKKSSLPEVYLDYAAIEQHQLAREPVEDAAARFLLGRPGIAQVFTRTQLEHGAVGATRLGLMVQRAWNRQRSGDLFVVPAPYHYFSSATSGASHGTPYTYDSHVPLVLYGKRWIRAARVPDYAEVVDIVPTLAYLLDIRTPSGADGRVLSGALVNAR
ncbi:MAG: alkaline phosphatase family protein [Telluria sp.]